MAVSRNALANTFNDGMNKDLNPILTPNTVMTDCLNGTIVTYNGNEFALQNDLGNYKFKHGELSDGFVPIGMKEHANILYIISYNPIEDKVEIGSFPSMKNIDSGFAVDGNENSLNNLVINEGLNNYTDLSKNFDLTFLSDLGDNYVLNPGDKYSLYEEVSSKEKWYITRYFYIMSENSQLYDITSVIDFSAKENDFKYVSWNIPGHMCCKYDIVHPSEFNAYVIQRDGKTKLKVQVFFNYNKRRDEELLDGKVYINYVNNGEIIHEALERSSKYNDLFQVYSGEFDWPDSDNDTLIIYPEIHDYDYDNNYYYYIVFDQFRTEIKKDIEEFDPDSVHIADELFKYYVGNSGLTLSLNIDSNPGCKAYYNLKRYLDTTIFTGQKVDDYKYVFESWQEISDLNISGQNVFNIKFTTKDWYNENKYTGLDQESNYINSIVLNKDLFEIIDDNIEDDKYSQIEKDYIRIQNTFDKEDIYELEIIVIPENENPNNDEFVLNEKNHCIFSETLYVSEYINTYRNQYDNYVGDFKLDKKAFVDAIEDQMKTVELFSKFNKEDDLVYYAMKDGIKYPFVFNLDTNDDIDLGDGVMIYQNWINQEIGSEDPHLNTDFSIYYGERYSSNIKPNELIEYPKNQYGTIGRLWRFCLPENVNLYATFNGKNESLGKNIIGDDMTFYFDISSSIDLFGEDNEVVKIDAYNPLKLSDMNYAVSTKYTETDANGNKFTWKSIDKMVDIWKDSSGTNTWSSGTAAFNNKFLYHIEREYNDDGAYDGTYIYIKWGTESTTTRSSGDNNEDSLVTIFPSDKDRWSPTDYSGGGEYFTSHDQFANWRIKIDDINDYRNYSESMDESLKSICDFFSSFSDQSSMIKKLNETGGFDWTDGNKDTTTLDTVNTKMNYPMLCLYFNNSILSSRDSYQIKKTIGNYATTGIGTFYDSRFLYNEEVTGNRWFFCILAPSDEDKKPCMILPNFDYSWNSEENNDNKETALFVVRCIIYYCYFLEYVNYCSSTKDFKFHYLYWNASQSTVSSKYIKNIESHYNLNWTYATINELELFVEISNDISSRDIICLEDVGKRKTNNSSSEILSWITNKIESYNKESMDSRNRKDGETVVNVGQFYSNHEAININNVNILSSLAGSLTRNSNNRIVVKGASIEFVDGIFANSGPGEHNRQMGFMHELSFEDN